MSDTSSLSELARFVGQSDPAEIRAEAVNAAVAGFSSGRRRGVTELLGAVMVLSARTRRMLLPPAALDLDVFTPDGKRAVHVILPQRA